MQPNPFPFSSVNPFLFNADLSEEGFERSRVLFLLPYLLFQGGADSGEIEMDFSKVSEKILSSVKSARSLGLLPSTSDRPEVPARAAAAAAVARALAGLPPHQRYNLPTSSEELSSIYGSRPPSQGVEELEEGFYEEEFDPVGFILEHIPSEESELEYFENQASLRLTQLDTVAEQLSRHVMEHHEVMVKGMDLVRELERDLKLATVICMNGRRRLTSSMNEVSRDLIVNTNAKKKQDLMDMLPILNDLRRALEMQAALEVLVEKENYCEAFQLLSEYLQLLDSLAELSVVQEMSSGVEVWLGKTLQKLDSLLMAVCRDFKDEGYVTVLDAYALIGDISGLAEKIQSFFMQEVLTETHSVLKSIVQEDQDRHNQTSRLTYSDLCLQIPDSKFRQCLLDTLAVLFRLMCSYDEIMTFHVKKENTEQNGNDIPRNQEVLTGSAVNKSESVEEKCGKVDMPHLLSMERRTSSTETSLLPESHNSVDKARDNSDGTSTSGSSWHELQKEATAYVSQTLQRGRKNLWQLTTSRVSVLLSSSAACSTSIHQFLRNYEDLNVFILAGESFCGAEAVEFRQKLKAICENYYSAFHRQNIYALKMVLEKETWIPLPSDTVQGISFAGLVGDGAPVIVQSHNYTNNKNLHTIKPNVPLGTGSKESGFSHWRRSGNPFMLKLTSASESSSPNGAVSGDTYRNPDNFSPRISESNHMNGGNSISEDENEDLLADFIDEDSQLPSRIAKSSVARSRCLQWNADEFAAQTGSSLCLLRTMDKYARLMQKLELINVELFKGICQLFEVFFYFVFETFGQQSTFNWKGSADALNYRLRTALSRVTQDCDQWLKPFSSPLSSSSPVSLNDVSPSHPATNSSTGLKERCAGTDTIDLVSRIMHRSRAHLQSLLLQNSAAIIDDFYVHLVDSVPDLIEHIQRTTARQLLHINGYVDRIVNAKWELKELGMEHNGYVDLLLGEFKHYKTRLAHGGIQKEVQDRMLEYGLDIVAETLVEGLSRVKRCTDEGRALMSLDLQVLINGLKHFVSFNVKPKLQIVETFIKAYYLPETEYVHWARAHPEYSKSQIVGLINLVASMKGWKRKARLELLEKVDLA